MSHIKHPQLPRATFIDLVERALTESGLAEASPRIADRVRIEAASAKIIGVASYGEARQPHHGAGRGHACPLVRIGAYERGTGALTDYGRRNAPAQNGLALHAFAARYDELVQRALPDAWRAVRIV